MCKPNLFIVGAPKCGTTSLYHYLDRHPDIFFPSVKEPHFFSTDLEWAFYHKKYDLDSYLSLFSSSADEKWRGEASVWYLYSRVAAENIKRFNPSARIICMLRNPVEMILSAHSFWVRIGAEDIPDLERALSLESSRRDGRSLPVSLRAPWAVLYHDIASFSSQLGRYYSVFDSSNIYVIIFDDLENAPGLVHERVMEFLQVEPILLDSYEAYNRTAQRSVDWYSYCYRREPGFRKVVKRLPGKALTWLKKGLALFPERTFRAEPVKMDLREELKNDFAEEVEALSRLLERDLTHWVR